MSVPALLQSLRHGEGFSKLPAILWNNAVQDFKGTDVFGAIHSLSGFNLYQKLNNNSLTVGVPYCTASTACFRPSMTALSAVCDNSDGSVTLTFAPAIAATEKVKLFASAAVSGGKSFVSRSFGYRHNGFNFNFSIVATTSILQSMVLLELLERKFFFATEQVKLTTGQAGRKVECSTVIVT